jgi:hypothetical protein
MVTMNRINWNTSVLEVLLDELGGVNVSEGNIGVVVIPDIVR